MFSEVSEIAEIEFTEPGGIGHLVSRTRCETRCCGRDEGRSLGVTLWKGASNRHELLRSKGVVVNVMVKRRG